MRFIKASAYTILGVLATICYRDGMTVAMNWIVYVFWLPMFVWDLVQTITPYSTDNKKSARHKD